MFHNEVGFTFGAGTIAVKGLGSYEYGVPYNDPIAYIVGDQYLLWDAQNIGGRVDLGTDALVVAGTFSDERNSSVPAVGILAHGCLGVTSVRERVPSSTAPTSALFQIVIYEGCEQYIAQLDGGYLLPLLRGEKKVADPNEFRFPSLVPSLEAASLADVEIVMNELE